MDTKPDPTQAKIHKIIEPEEVFKKTGYSRPHTVHCGPEGIYVSTLGGGGKDGTNGPPQVVCPWHGLRFGAVVLGNGGRDSWRYLQVTVRHKGDHLEITPSAADGAAKH